MCEYRNYYSHYEYVNQTAHRRFLRNKQLSAFDFIRETTCHR
jgi:hypothetical protein